MDTAQPLEAAETDPNAQLAEAAEAFKAFDTPPQPRAEDGKFAPKPQEEEEEAEDVEEGEAEEGELDDTDEADEAEEEAVEETQPLPPSWPEDMADQWEQLPPETQALIVEREGERERAVQAKFQESANVRKEAEQAREQASASRKEAIEQIDLLTSLINPVKPDPRAFGAGTAQYDRGAYDLALAEYEQQAQALAQFTEQRKELAAQEEQEAAKAFEQWKTEHEEQFRPKLLTDVPELTDPQKADPLLRSLITYAIENGVPAELFAEDRQKEITSAQIHMMWKAKEYDRIKSGTSSKPKPKPAGPAVKPGVSSPRSATKAARNQKARDRLAREGSIEAGAAVWKQHL